MKSTEILRRLLNRHQCDAATATAAQIYFDSVLKNFFHIQIDQMPMYLLIKFVSLSQSTETFWTGAKPFFCKRLKKVIAVLAKEGGAKKSPVECSCFSNKKPQAVLNKLMYIRSALDTRAHSISYIKVLRVALLY